MTHSVCQIPTYPRTGWGVGRNIDRCITRPSLNRSFTIRHAVSLPLRRHSRIQSQLATLVKRYSVPRTWKSRDSRARAVDARSTFLIGERSEPHTYRTVGKNLRHIYIYVFYIYIYIYTFVRRARARYAQTSDRPVEVQRSI